MAILSANRPFKDFAGATRGRAIADRRLQAKLASNQEIADAHKMPPGAGPFTVSTEAQPAHRRPVIRKPG